MNEIKLIKSGTKEKSSDDHFMTDYRYCGHTVVDADDTIQSESHITLNSTSSMVSLSHTVRKSSCIPRALVDIENMYKRKDVLTRENYPRVHPQRDSKALDVTDETQWGKKLTCKQLLDYFLSKAVLWWVEAKPSPRPPNRLGNNRTVNIRMQLLARTQIVLPAAFSDKQKYVHKKITL